ncbi:unnamed protein product [Closterium sp. Naga37s-1]|nr:unnamed protein product [Closterium sp. Naga37s-1]
MERLEEQKRVEREMEEKRQREEEERKREEDRRVEREKEENRQMEEKERLEEQKRVEREMEEKRQREEEERKREEDRRVEREKEENRQMEEKERLEEQKRVEREMEEKRQREEEERKREEDRRVEREKEENRQMEEKERLEEQKRVEREMEEKRQREEEERKREEDRRVEREKEENRQMEEKERLEEQKRVEREMEEKRQREEEERKREEDRRVEREKEENRQMEEKERLEEQKRVEREMEKRQREEEERKREEDRRVEREKDENRQMEEKERLEEQKRVEREMEKRQGEEEERKREEDRRVEREKEENRQREKKKRLEEQKRVERGMEEKRQREEDRREKQQREEEEKKREEDRWVEREKEEKRQREEKERLEKQKRVEREMEKWQREEEEEREQKRLQAEMKEAHKKEEARKRQERDHKRAESECRRGELQRLEREKDMSRQREEAERGRPHRVAEQQAGGQAEEVEDTEWVETEARLREEANAGPVIFEETEGGFEEVGEHIACTGRVQPMTELLRRVILMAQSVARMLADQNVRLTQCFSEIRQVGQEFAERDARYVADIAELTSEYARQKESVLLEQAELGQLRTALSTVAAAARAAAADAGRAAAAAVVGALEDKFAGFIDRIGENLKGVVEQAIEEASKGGKLEAIMASESLTALAKHEEERQQKELEAEQEKIEMERQRIAAEDVEGAEGQGPDVEGRAKQGHDVEGAVVHGQVGEADEGGWSEILRVVLPVLENQLEVVDLEVDGEDPLHLPGHGESETQPPLKRPRTEQTGTNFDANQGSFGAVASEDMEWGNVSGNQNVQPMLGEAMGEVAQPRKVSLPDELGKQWGESKHFRSSRLTTRKKKDKDGVVVSRRYNSEQTVGGVKRNMGSYKEKKLRDFTVAICWMAYYPNTDMVHYGLDPEDIGSWTVHLEFALGVAAALYTLWCASIGIPHQDWGEGAVEVARGTLNERQLASRAANTAQVGVWALKMVKDHTHDKAGWEGKLPKVILNILDADENDSEAVEMAKVVSRVIVYWCECSLAAQSLCAYWGGMLNFPQPSKGGRRKAIAGGNE